MTLTAFRALGWASIRSPLVRTEPQASKLSNAMDLTVNLRGIGWTWSKGLRLPTSKPYASTSYLASTRLASGIIHALIFDFIHLGLQWTFPSTRSGEGVSIFDRTLTPFIRYSFSSVIALVVGLLVLVPYPENYLTLHLRHRSLLLNHLRIQCHLRLRSPPSASSANYVATLI